MNIIDRKNEKIVRTLCRPATIRNQYLTRLPLKYWYCNYDVSINFSSRVHTLHTLYKSIYKNKKKCTFLFVILQSSTVSHATQSNVENNKCIVVGGRCENAVRVIIFVSFSNFIFLNCFYVDTRWRYFLTRGLLRNDVSICVNINVYYIRANPFGSVYYYYTRTPKSPNTYSKKYGDVTLLYVRRIGQWER